VISAHHARILANARAIAGVFFLLLLGGCASFLPQTSGLRDAWPQDLPAHAELVDVPFFPQEEYQCGPAALATVMAAASAKVKPDDLVAQVYIPERKGSLQLEMLAAPRKYGLVSYALSPKLDEVLREVASGSPVVVLLGYSVWPFKQWHYAVVVGFDRERAEVILRSGVTQRKTMPFAVLEYTWKESGHWAMVTARPQKIPVTADESRYLEAVNAMARVSDARASASAYGAFLQRWPENIAAAIGMGNALHASGHLKLAEIVLRDALKRHADSVPLLNNLAQTLSDQGRNKEALEVIDKAGKLGGPLAGSVRETREAIERRLGPRR
jgi:tetratricopeptide (TPR) repeat protein